MKNYAATPLHSAGTIFSCPKLCIPVPANEIMTSLCPLRQMGPKLIPTNRSALGDSEYNLSAWILMPHKTRMTKVRQLSFKVTHRQNCVASLSCHAHFGQGSMEARLRTKTLSNKVKRNKWVKYIREMIGWDSSATSTTDFCNCMQHQQYNH